MKLRNIMACMLGLGTGNMCAQIIGYAFEQNVASGVLAIISSIMYIIASGYFAIMSKNDQEKQNEERI